MDEAVDEAKGCSIAVYMGCSNVPLNCNLTNILTYWLTLFGCSDYLLLYLSDFYILTCILLNIEQVGELDLLVLPWLML